MDEGEWKVLHGFAAMLDSQPRKGAPVDVPEGARMLSLKISDTFAIRLSMALRQCSGQLETLEATTASQAEDLELLRNQINLLTDPKIIVPRR